MRQRRIQPVPMRVMQTVQDPVQVVPVQDSSTLPRIEDHTPIGIQTQAAQCGHTGARMQLKSAIGLTAGD